MNLRGVTLIVGLLVVAPHAQAQSDQERSAARSTAKSGIVAFQEKRYADALELLTKAESVVHAPTHLLLMARSQVELGLLVEAQESYLKVINETLAAKAPPAFHQAQEEAKLEVKPLESRIARLNLEVPGADLEELSITLDGIQLSNNALGLAIPVNPGKHTLSIAARGKIPQELNFKLGEGENKSLQVNLKETNSSQATAEDVVVEDTTEPATSSRHYWGYGLAATGVVSLGVGTAFGIIALNAGGKAKDDPSLCPNGQCTPKGDEYIASAKVKAMVANISLGVGATLVAVGAYLALTDPSEPEKEHVRLEPMTGPGDFSLSLRGSF